MTNEERELHRMLKELADVSMDRLTEIYAKNLADMIIAKIDEISAECKEMADRKNLLIVKLIDSLQDHVDKHVSDVKVE